MVVHRCSPPFSRIVYVPPFSLAASASPGAPGFAYSTRPPVWHGRVLFGCPPAPPLLRAQVSGASLPFWPLDAVPAENVEFWMTRSAEFSAHSAKVDAEALPLSA